MKTLRPMVVIVCVLAAIGAMVAGLAPRAEARTRIAFVQPGFVTIDIYVDAGNTPLAAYQFEFTAPGAKLVGVEGGEHAAFAEAPYYDPAALADNGAPGQGERIIVAAFSTDKQLPSGRVRIARLHLHKIALADDGQIHHKITLMTAGDAQGNEIKATVEAFRVLPGTNNMDDNEGDVR